MTDREITFNIHAKLETRENISSVSLEEKKLTTKTLYMEEELINN